MSDKYSHFDDLAVFGFLVNAMSGGGDRDASFPRSDAEDLSCGARFIPGEVTMARRDGRRVQFVHDCENPCCWYWLMPNGDRSYHWSPGRNPGPCRCGNEHTNGGTVKAEFV